MPEESMAEGVVGQKLPSEVEMVLAAFMPNLRHMESRFDRIDLSIKDLGIGIKDTNNLNKWTDVSSKWTDVWI